jgi:regulator of replication initiation timing
LTELEANTADLEIQVNSKERLIQEMVLEVSTYRITSEDLREKLEEKETLIKTLETAPSRLGDKERMANLGALLDGWVGENGDGKAKSERDVGGSVWEGDGDRKL